MIQTFSLTVGDSGDSPKTFQFVVFLAVSAVCLTALPSLFITSDRTLVSSFSSLERYSSRINTTVFAIVSIIVVTMISSSIDHPKPPIKPILLTSLFLLLSIPFMSTTFVTSCGHRHHEERTSFLAQNCEPILIQESDVQIPQRVVDNNIPTWRALLSPSYWCIS